MENTSRTALVTGASNGIGKEFAIKLAQNGHDVIMVARETDKLQSAADQISNQYKVNTYPITKDLAHEKAAHELVEEVNALDLNVSVLINNAGFGHKAYFHKTDAGINRAMMGLNIACLTELTHLLLPSMIESKHGRILNVSSTAAYQPGPLMAVYFASKSYVSSFSQALHSELQGTGVSVTLLCPGPTITSFAETAKLTGNPIHSGFVPMWTPDKVAEVGYNAMMRGKRIVIAGFVNKLTSFLGTVMPTAMVMRSLKKMHAKG